MYKLPLANLFNLLLKTFLQIFVAPDELVKDLNETENMFQQFDS